MIKQAGMGTPGANLAEVSLESLDRLVHLLFGGFLEIGNHVGIQ
jgi:hypothetical protein